MFNWWKQEAKLRVNVISNIQLTKRCSKWERKPTKKPYSKFVIVPTGSVRTGNYFLGLFRWPHLSFGLYINIGKYFPVRTSLSGNEYLIQLKKVSTMFTPGHSYSGFEISSVMYELLYNRVLGRLCDE